MKTIKRNFKYSEIADYSVNVAPLLLPNEVARPVKTLSMTTSDGTYESDRPFIVHWHLVDK